MRVATSSLVAGLAFGASCDFERVDGSTLSAEEFRKRFRTGPLGPGRPVVLTGLRLGRGLDQAKGGKGGEKIYEQRLAEARATARKRGGPSPFGEGWDHELLEASFGESTVQSQQVVVYRYSTGTSRPMQTGLGEATLLSSVLRLRDSTLFLLKPSHPAAQAWGEALKLPEYLRPIQLTGPTVSLGSANASSPPHQHPENWFAQLSGAKAWVVAPPDAKAAEDWMKAHRPCDLWHDKQKAAKVKEIKTCLLDAGEVLYLPSQWRHGTCNVGEFSAGIGYIGAIDHLPKVTWLTALDDLSGLKEALKEKDDVMEALTVKDRDGKQPLHWAAHRGHQRMVRELLKMRALASATDRHGARPVHLAAFEGHEKALRELLEVETRKSATARTDGGAEPLHLAATKGHSSVAKLLLRKRASPSARDNKGAEPLHMAAYEGHVSMVDLLLAAGAAPDAGADDGTDPAKLAWTRGHKDLAHKLNDAIPKKSTSGRKTLGPLHDEF